MSIRNIVDSIDCELAAVATSPEETIRSRNLQEWVAATELDLTLVRSIGVDGNVKVSAPAGLAVVSGLPKAGILDTDTRKNSIKFANSIPRAIARYKTICQGFDPSETGMGLANWIAASVTAIEKDSLVSLSFTKQFEINASASSRFGYVLVPVTNPVSADAGFGGAIDYTNRFTIALTPPPAPAPPAKPLLVTVTNFPARAPSPDATIKKNEENDQATKQPPAGEAAPQSKPTVRPPKQPTLTPRQRVLGDPEINRQLYRNSPVILDPGSFGR
ncbi:hypothetical protein [Bradyrhizobium sp. HKCCYLR20261]|uniref:hypothetical protein n=1 Tax=Bradyrhizobium sp. HKCCYLR20261 TaxID=3420760 RepID=UPI003EBE0DC4